MQGAKATEKGDCSRFELGGIIPHSCKKNPTIVDATPSTPYSKRITDCCRGGVLGSLLPDPANSITAFQLFVGEAGMNNGIIRLPKNFTLTVPGYVAVQRSLSRPHFLAQMEGESLLKLSVSCNLFYKCISIKILNSNLKENILLILISLTIVGDSYMAS